MSIVLKWELLILKAKIETECMMLNKNIETWASCSVTVTVWLSRHDALR